MEFDLNGSNSYRVEVSGWDAKENFFVEKTMLDWRAERYREVSLQSRVRQGAVVFVRLLRPLATESDFPIAYQVANVAGRGGGARTRVQLIKLQTQGKATDEARILN